MFALRRTLSSSSSSLSFFFWSQDWTWHEKPSCHLYVASWEITGNRIGCPGIGKQPQRIAGSYCGMTLAPIPATPLEVTCCLPLGSLLESLLDEAWPPSIIISSSIWLRYGRKREGIFCLILEEWMACRRETGGEESVKAETPDRCKVLVPMRYVLSY